MKIVMSTGDVAAYSALFLSLLSLYWTNLRPAKLTVSFATVIATRNGGEHISIPLAISNEGARATSILGAKVAESLNGRTTLYDVALESSPEKSADAEFGRATKQDVFQFVPFTLLPNTTVQKVLIFTPVNGGLLAKSLETSTFTLVLHTAEHDIPTKEAVYWPAPTNAMLQKAIGVSAPVSAVSSWQSELP